MFTKMHWSSTYNLYLKDENNIDLRILFALFITSLLVKPEKKYTI